MGKIKQNKPKFEAGKAYQWEEGDEFVLTGIQFSVVYNTLKDYFERGSVPLQRVIDSNNILHGLLVQGIEDGVVVEMKPVQKAPVDTLLDEAVKKSSPQLMREFP